MNTHIIKPIFAVTLLMWSASLIPASQLSEAGSGAAATGPAEDPTVAPDDSALNGSSKAPPVPAEHRDSAFVWNIAFRAYGNQRNVRDQLHLSDQQAADFRSLCSDYSDWKTDFLQRRDAPDDGTLDSGEKMRTLHAESYGRMAKFREDFLAILTDSQRDDVYRQTLKNGGAFALLHPELRKRFELTEEPVQKISEIRDINWGALSLHFTTATDAYNRKTAEPFIAAAWEQLTDDQKAQFTRLVPDEPASPRLAMKPSTPEDDAPPGYLDGTFLWNQAWRVSASNRPTSSDRPPRTDDLQLSEEQVAKVKTLSEEMKNEMEELIEAARNAMIDRGGIELATADQEKTMRWQQEQNRTALALKMKTGEAFMELLSDSQRNEMYRQSMLLGGAFALLEPSLREKFQLTEAQVQALHKIRDENWHTLRTHFVSGNKPPFKRIETYLAAALDQLTDDQKTQLEHFTAKPFIAQAVDAAAQSNDPPPSGLTEHVQTTRESQGDTGHSLTGGTEVDVPRGNARQVSSGGLMITWSENNDEVRGFSNSLGEWETLKIEKQDSIIPVLGSDVAAVRTGDSIAAFSGVKGWWDVIALSKGSSAQPTVSNDLVAIEDNGHLYTFAAAKGRWTSPTDPDLQPIHDQIDIQANPKAVVFAEGPFQQWLESLPRYKARGVRAQFSGAGFVDLYVERRSQLDEVRAAFSQALKRHEGIVAAEKSPSSVLDVAEVEKKITDLRGELQQLEFAVEASSGTNNSPDAKQDDQQRALRTLVEKSFDLRQQLQRHEAQRMHLRLQLIEANLNARDRNREDIIQHRVNELLDSKGKLTERGAGDKTTPGTNAGMPATGTPIGLPGPPELPYGGPVGLATHPANSDSRIQWPQPTEIVKDLQKRRIHVTTCLSILKQSEKKIELWSKPLEELKAAGIAGPKMSESLWSAEIASAKSSVDDYRESLDRALRDWNHAWSAYQSKLRLLRLDLEEAKLALESLTAECDQLRQLFERATVSYSEVQKTESRLAVARINVQRAEEMLKLYADIETLEPQLNPDSFKSEK